LENAQLEVSGKPSGLVAAAAVKVKDWPSATLAPAAGAVMLALLGAVAMQNGLTVAPQVVPVQVLLAVPRVFRSVFAGRLEVWQSAQELPDAR
jgi:hypothetical protein